MSLQKTTCYLCKKIINVDFISKNHHLYTYHEHNYLFREYAQHRLCPECHKLMKKTLEEKEG